MSTKLVPIPGIENNGPITSMPYTIVHFLNTEGEFYLFCNYNTPPSHGGFVPRLFLKQNAHLPFETDLLQSRLLATQLIRPSTWSMELRFCMIFCRQLVFKNNGTWPSTCRLFHIRFKSETINVESLELEVRYPI